MTHAAPTAPLPRRRLLSPGRRSSRFRHRAQREAQAHPLAKRLPPGGVATGEIALDGGAAGLQAVNLALERQDGRGAGGVLGDRVSGPSAVMA